MTFFEESPNIPISAHKDLKTGPYNQCVYCGRLDANGGLTDEHVIPRALGGRIVMTKASCSACQKITSRIESKCLNEMFSAVRSHWRFKYSTAKRKRGRFPLKIARADREAETVYVPSNQFPHMLFLPVFDSPGLYVSNASEEFAATKMIGLKLNDFERRLSAILAKTKAKSIKIPMNNFPIPFGRFLAKIAHGTAIAKLGIEGFIPFLPNIILESDPNVGLYVGGATPRAPQPSQPDQPVRLSKREWEVLCHSFCLTTCQHPNWHGDLVVCLIKLFAMFENAPLYEVVVGEGRPDTSERLTASA